MLIHANYSILVFNTYIVYFCEWLIIYFNQLKL